MKHHHIRPLARSAVAIILALSLSACGDSHENALASARADFAGGNVNSATLRLRSALQTDPQFAEARLLLGQILLDTGETAAAEKELRKAFEAGIETETVKPLLARAMLEMGEYRRVLSDFPPQQIRSPEVRAEVLVSQAYALLFQGNVEAAKQTLQQAFAASPDHLRATIAKALITGVEGDYDAASLAIDKVLSRQPKSAEALRAKASIAQGKGDLPGAIQALQTLTQLRASDVAAHYQTIMLLWQAGRMDDARAQIERMQAAAEGHPRTEHLLALMAMQDKDLPAARDHVALALKADPEFGPSLLLSGTVNAQLGEYELAEHHFSKVLAQDPNNLPAQQALIGILLRTQRAERALLVAKDMLARAPEQPRALQAAASAYLQAGDTKTAKSLFEKANALGARDAKVLTGLALAHMASGDASQGIKALMDASAADESRIEADFLLVGQFVARKQFDKALEAVATMASKRPGDGRILNLEGEVLLAAGRKGEARSAFERAYELQPGFIVPLRYLGRLDLADGKPERAKKRFEDAIARRPKDQNVLLVYAEWLNDSKSDADAVRAVVEKAVAVAPADVNARISLAAFHASRRDFDRAVTVAEEATKAIPDNERLLTALAELQIRAGKPELAVITLSKAIKITPASPQLLVRLADVQLATGAVGDATASLRKALSVRPNFRPAKVRLVALEQPAGRTAETIEAARELQNSQPTDPIGYFIEGKVFVQQGKWPEAVRVLKTGIERSHAPQLVVGLHSALLKASRPEEAAKVVADWIKVNPRDVVVRRYLADVALAARDYPAAVRLYKDLAVDFPNHAGVLNNLAWAAARAGDPMALEYAERASRLAPDDPKVLDTLGSILVERGDLVRGTETLRRASAAAPNAPEVRLNLARALIKSGDTTGARRELEGLVKLGDKFPQQDEVKKLLAGL